MDYKWDCPHHWLRDHISGYLTDHSTYDTLAYYRQVIENLAAELYCDQIQDLFQGGMSTDGYFKEKA